MPDAPVAPSPAAAVSPMPGSAALPSGSPSLGTRLARWSLGRLLAEWGAPGLAEGPPGSRPPGEVRMRLVGDLDPLALWRDPWLTLGDAYADGRLQVEGDLVVALERTFRAQALQPGRFAGTDEGRRRTLARSRASVHHHYDIGNDFYALWLDSSMSYTCAYFSTPDATLEAAQTAKMEHVCRKLALRPGERLLELGCGWGGLALHAARHHGVRVRAFNVSAEQVRHARDAARREGLAGRVEFVEDDYRNASGRYDALVSVGMLEHVGRSSYRELGGLIEGCLTADGRGLLHSIGRHRPTSMNSWIERRIFPGGYIPTLRELLEVLEPWDLAVRDVEDLRPHYARTLEHWLARLEGAADRVRALHDERLLRTFRLYLASSIAAFRTGWTHLYQVLFARSACERLPWTRAHLYAPPAPVAEAPWTPATS